jgi:hypothetical protein
MTALYPVHVEAHIDPRLSRWQWLFKWLLAIPHYVVLAFLWVAFVVLSFVAFFAILFTGRYPRSIFDFNVGVLRWTWRVSYYAYGALGTDRYPPFTLQERADYPAHLEVDYPVHLSRGLVLVKWWLLAIPHYLVVGLFLGGAGLAVGRANDSNGAGASAGLIGLLVLFAAVVLLFTGRYPRPIFDLVLGLNRWVLRVGAYAALMTDVYPPFRLDQGGDDPTTLRAAGTAGADPGGATGWPADPGAPTHVTPGPASPVPTRTHAWTVGRAIALVAGCVVMLGSIGVGLGGGAAAIADHGLRDDAGYLMTGTTTLTTGTYAITSTSLTLDAGLPSAFMPDQLLGDVKVTATSADVPVFVGIAATSDVDAYLGDAAHATLTDFNDSPVYETSGTTGLKALPATTDIWVVQASGTGTQQVVWPARSGHWTVVIVNADGSRGVNADVAAGATVPALGWLAPTLLAAAALGLVIAILLFVAAFRRTGDVHGATGTGR